GAIAVSLAVHFLGGKGMTHLHQAARGAEVRTGALHQLDGSLAEVRRDRGGEDARQILFPQIEHGHEVAIAADSAFSDFSEHRPFVAEFSDDPVPAGRPNRGRPSPASTRS